MVCGGSTPSSSGVWAGILSITKYSRTIWSMYYLPLKITPLWMFLFLALAQSDMDGSVFSPVKRKFESNDSDQSSKVPKLTESIDNDISINLDSHCIPSLPDSPDLLLNGFITGTVNMTRDLLLGSINNLTIPKKMRIAICIRLESETILINREIRYPIFGANLHQYYYSLESRLANKFQHNIFLIHSYC